MYQLLIKITEFNVGIKITIIKHAPCIFVSVDLRLFVGQELVSVAYPERGKVERLSCCIIIRRS